MSGKNQLKNGNVDEAIAYARQCLEQRLVPELRYHNLTHTFEHVMPAALELADLCGVSQEEKQLLMVAVAFHDTGWIFKGHGHERIGAALARKKLPALGFSKRQVDRITSMILATQMPHQPTCLLDSILIDADMAILSRDDFWLCNDELRAELELLGDPLSDSEWYESQLAFLEKHRYFTNVAIAGREQVKEKHILELRQRLEACYAEAERPLIGHTPIESLVKSESDG